MNISLRSSDFITSLCGKKNNSSLVYANGFLISIAEINKKRNINGKAIDIINCKSLLIRESKSTLFDRAIPIAINANIPKRIILSVLFHAVFTVESITLYFPNATSILLLKKIRLNLLYCCQIVDFILIQRIGIFHSLLAC